MSVAEFVTHVRAIFVRLGIVETTPISMKCVRWQGRDRWIAKAWRARSVADTDEGAMQGVLLALLDLASHDERRMA